MTSAVDVRRVEDLLATWNSRRAAENNRRAEFIGQRDEAVTRWRERGPHTEADEHYVEFRLARSVTTLAEAIEIDERSGAALASCRGELEALPALGEKERKKLLARIRDLAESAIRQDMRYLAALTSSFQSEIDQVASFMHERENDSSY